MRQSLFVLGLLTGSICALPFVLGPLPARTPQAPQAIVMPKASFRMSGFVRRNSCGLSLPPWPDVWHLTGRGLAVGEWVFEGDASGSAVSYVSNRASADGCLAASWVVKLRPSGRGVRGTASWEVRSRGGGQCVESPRTPCLIEADVEGLPEEQQAFD